MGEVKLNLGPYNRCIDILGNAPSSYPVLECESGIVTVVSSEEKIIKVVHTSDGMVTIPTLFIATAIKNDTPENRKQLIEAIELKILSMVYKIIDAAKIDAASIDSLDRITIPVKFVTMACNEFGVLRIKAEIGVCAFEEGVVGISV